MMGGGVLSGKLLQWQERSSEQGAIEERSSEQGAERRWLAKAHLPFGLSAAALEQQAGLPDVRDSATAHPLGLSSPTHRPPPSTVIDRSGGGLRVGGPRVAQGFRAPRGAGREVGAGR